MSTDTSDESFELTADQIADRADMQLRYALAEALGDSLDGNNDLYETFNWDKNPGVEKFYASYLRNPYGRAVADLPVNTTWRDPPDVVDEGEPPGEEETDSRFESAVEDLNTDERVWHYCKRADKLSGIGEFGILVLELDDISEADDFATEATSASSLNGLRPFSQASVEELKTGGPGSGRWGEPVRYKVDLTDENDAVQTDGPDELWVHHSRVIHIPSEGLLDDEIRGTPRQEPVWNNLTDIQKSLGSAAELAYRASAWGLNVNLDKDFQLEDGGDEMREQLNRWYYGLEPILRTHGAQEVQSLGGEEIDPSLIIDPNVEAISAQTGIPQSVLKGNETGERATTEDLKEWYGKVAERREEFVAPVIVRELIDRLLGFGVIPDPRGGGFEIEWKPLAETSEADVADIEHTRAETLSVARWLQDALETEQQAEYIKDGSLPTEFDEAELEAPEFPENDPEVQEQFQQMQPPQTEAVPDGGQEDEADE